MDPYTGKVLGEGSRRARAFFHAMTDWHRFLGAQGESRAAGRAITEASGRITAETAKAIAATGVDLISAGWLTHSSAALDIGLDFLEFGSAAT